jgi:RHS repeat-associated protein
MIGDRASKVVLPKAVVGLWLLVWWVMLWLGSTGPALGLGLGDRAGNPLCCAATSTLTAYYDYDAFGSMLRATGPAALANAYRFSAKPVDEETGLVYYGYRWYHPELGRWLSRDPIGEAGGLNLYGMVDNDPVNGVDVLGLAVLSDAEWETAKSKFSGLPEWGKVVLHFDDCNRLWKFHPVHQIWVRFGEAREGSNKCCSKDNFFRGPRGFDPREGADPWLVRLIDNIVGSPKQIVANKPNLSESLNPGADLAQMRDDAMRAGGDALANAGVVLEVVTPSPTDALLAAGFLHGMMRGAARTTTAPFKSGEIITREFASSGGPVEMAAEAIINGRSLHLKDIAVFPRGAESLDIGMREVLRLRGQLADEVAGMGFDSLRITGTRLTGANPGKVVDMTIDLTKPR